MPTFVCLTNPVPLSGWLLRLPTRGAAERDQHELRQPRLPQNDRGQVCIGEKSAAADVRHADGAHRGDARAAHSSRHQRVRLMSQSKGCVARWGASNACTENRVFFSAFSAIREESIIGVTNFAHVSFKKFKMDGAPALSRFPLFMDNIYLVRTSTTNYPHVLL